MNCKPAAVYNKVQDWILNNNKKIWFDFSLQALSQLGM